MLSGKVVLMTGAGRGLGKVMSLALLRNGASVALTATDHDSLIETIAESGVDEGRATAICADLSNLDECSRVVHEAEAAFGRIDILVNNAGLGTDAIRKNYRGNPFAFWEVDAEKYDLLFRINSTAPYRLAALVAPGMISRGWGRIVNNTTSLDSMLRAPVYGGSKAALEAHTAVMARDLLGTGVTANVLVPGGPAVSRMTENLNVPSDLMIPAEVMAAPIIWLASDDSDGITGRRFLACDWNSSLPPVRAAERAGHPVAWTGLGAGSVQPIDPARPTALGG